MNGVASKRSSYYFDIGGLIELSRDLKFKALLQLGTGGQSQVYLVKDCKSGVLSVIKLMDPVLAATQPGSRESFEYEGIVHGRLGRHANIIELKFMGYTVDPPDNPVLVMEYLRGETLQDALKAQGGKLSLSKVVEIGRRAAEGLHHGHRLHVVHLDVKPSNLFIYYDDHGRLGLKVLDWGASQLLEELAKGKETDRFYGTPSFAASEHLLGHSNIWITADIFSLGVVLYVAASGKWPFGDLGSSYEAQLSRVNCKPIPISTYGDFLPAFVDLLNRMLDPNPRKRPQSMLEVMEELKVILLDCSLEVELPLPTEERVIRNTEGKDVLTVQEVQNAARMADALHSVKTQPVKVEPPRHVPDPSTQDAPFSPSLQAAIRRAMADAERRDVVHDTHVDPIRIYPPPESPVSHVIVSPTVRVQAAPSNPPVPSAQPMIPCGEGGTVRMERQGPPPKPPPEWEPPPALVESAQPEEPAQDEQAQDEQAQPVQKPRRHDISHFHFRATLITLCYYASREPEDLARAPVHFKVVFKALRRCWRAQTLSDWFAIFLIFGYLLLPIRKLQYVYLLFLAPLALRQRWKSLFALLVGYLLLAIISGIVTYFLLPSPPPSMPPMETSHDQPAP